MPVFQPSFIGTLISSATDSTISWQGLRMLCSPAHLRRRTIGKNAQCGTMAIVVRTGFHARPQVAIDAPARPESDARPTQVVLLRRAGVAQAAPR
jgi:hypothetical protein